MVRMIPPYYKEDYVSNGEKKIFKALEKMDMECTVFHSLGLSNHLDKVFGEIDFVIVCNYGILCLEIKGGSVYREDGIWYFQDRYGNVNSNTEGPFKQVVGNMYSLQKYLKKNLGYQHPLVRCQYACGVIFPDITFNRKGPDFISEIVYDNRFTDDDLKTYIRNVFDYWANITKEKHSFEGLKLSNLEIRQAEKILRGNFSCIPSLGYIANEVDSRLIELTEEQYNIFKMFTENKRIILNGGAGTGKTLLAFEHAKRLASIGKKVLFLCFNKLIASYLRYNFEKEVVEYKGNIEITNFHEFIGRFMDTFDLASYNYDEFFKIIMPERFLEYVKINRFNEKYDAVIIDEGQDLLRINYLLCIDEVLKGGLKDGSWYVFYDSNQNIYNNEFKDGYKLLVEYRPTILSLTLNCRNTKQIGTYNMLITGLNYERIMKVNGENVVREEYIDNNELQRKLIKLIKQLKHNEIRLGDIIILSPYSFENSGLEGKNIFHSICKFQNISSMKFNNILEDSLKFCTIHSFKGMESKVVIIIDMDKFDNINARLLNYTAISRARVLLYMFIKNSATTELNEVIKENLQKLQDFI